MTNNAAVGLACSNPRSALGPIAFQVSAGIYSVVLGSQESLFGPDRAASRKLFSQSVLVGLAGASAGRKDLGPAFPSKDYHRHQLVGLGSSLRLAGLGSLVAQGGSLIKLQGAVSGRKGFKQVCKFFFGGTMPRQWFALTNGGYPLSLLISWEILSWVEDNVSSIIAVHISGTTKVLAECLLQWLGAEPGNLP